MVCEESVITLYDLKRLFVRSAKPLKRIVICAFLLTFFFCLIRKPQYLAKASFKQMGKQSDVTHLAKDFLKDLSLPAMQNTPIFAVMHSNAVLKKVIENLGLQVSVNSFSLNPFFLFQRTWDNLCCEIGLLPTDTDGFSFRSVSYLGERPLQLFVRPLTETSYEILNAEKKSLGFGEVGKPLRLSECAFTLQDFPRRVSHKKSYGFAISPWMHTAQKVRKVFEIREYKLDKNVYTLYFQHPHRALAAEFLNQAMAHYQEFFQKENEEICAIQVAYLEKRHAELIQQFDAALQEHATYLKKNIDETGFMGYFNEFNAFAQPHNDYTSKLFDIDLELKRLETLYAPMSDWEKKRAKIPSLKLRENLEGSLLQCTIEKDLFPHTLPNSDTGFDLEMEGVDCEALTLQSAKNLYLYYTEKKDQQEALLRERLFLREKLSDPAFELSSLSTLLNDSISASLAQNASTIALKLNDGENRTAREQERLKEELENQKRFLLQHLTYMIELQKSQLKLLTHKIEALQLQTTDLLSAEKHLIEEKIGDLKHKMSVLPEKWRRENLLFLRKDLGSRLLASLHQFVETKNLTQKLYQVSSRHLDLSYTPLDAQHPFILIYSLLTAFCAGFVCYVSLLCHKLLTGFPVSAVNLKYAGIYTYGTLSKQCGDSLEKLKDADIECLRGLTQFLSPMDKGSCVGVLTGKNPDCSENLAHLLSLSGKKVLRIQYTFDADSSAGEEPGLWQYVHGLIKEIPIRHKDQCDELCLGSSQRFATDILLHPAFHSLLLHLKEKYDILLLHGTTALARRETQAFAHIADALIATTRDECLEDLLFYRRWEEAKAKHSLALACFD